MPDANIEFQYNLLKRKLFDKYYSKLNDVQRECVYTINGPLMILAGAGSGKTTVLVNRLTYIVRYGDAYKNDWVPDDITRDDLTDMQKAYDTLSRDELGEYQASIKIYCNDRSGLLVDITRIFTERGINISGIHSKTSKQGIATIDVSFNTKGRIQINNLIEKLRQVENIIDIERTTG